MANQILLDLASITLDRPEGAFVMPWPTPGNPATLLQFTRYDAWYAFIDALSLHEAIPWSVAGKFERARRLYVLGWVDMGLVKAGELAALSALELALKDRYGDHFRKKYAQITDARKRQQKLKHGPMLHDLLQHLVQQDGLTDVQLPFSQRYGGSVIDALAPQRSPEPGAVRSPRPTLAEIRNALAHGDPFEGWPWSGLLELVRDLIEYAYRHDLQAAPPRPGDALNSRSC